jgi:transposase
VIRDVRFLIEHPNAKNRAYGKRVLQALRNLFGLIHRRGKMSNAKFLGALEDQGTEIWTQATYRVPQMAEAQNLANRLQQHGREYLRFITTPGGEPTNNLAEQAIRFVVIDRRVTQGSRSLAGHEWLERNWTAIATCNQHGQNVFNYLNRSVRALFADQPPPALLFGTS